MPPSRTALRRELCLSARPRVALDRVRRDAAAPPLGQQLEAESVRERNRAVAEPLALCERRRELEESLAELQAFDRVVREAAKRQSEAPPQPLRPRRLAALKPQRLGSDKTL